jgi:hypothetical protein
LNESRAHPLFLSAARTEKATRLNTIAATRAATAALLTAAAFCSRLIILVIGLEESYYKLRDIREV